MKKQIISLILICLMTISMIQPAYSSVISFIIDTPDVFKTDETTEFATGNYVCEQINSIMEKDYAIDGGEALITVDEFLHLFSGRIGMFIYYNAEGWYYPLEDSVWCSAEEWTYMIRNLTSNISKEAVDMFLQRASDFYYYGKNRYIPENIEEFTELIDMYYPEFSLVIDESPKALKFWFNAINRSSFYDVDSIGDTIHEILHEQSAIQSGVFEKRSAGDTTWSVWWNGSIRNWYIYDFTLGEWKELGINSTPKTSKLLNDVAPEKVKTSLMYKTYYKANSIANDNGFYGILQEFTSTLANLRVASINASLNYHYDDIPSTTCKEYYFWKGSLLHYLNQLELDNPSKYHSLLSDSTLVDLLIHLIDFGDKQIFYDNRFENFSNETGVMKNWTDDDIAKKQYRVLKSINSGKQIYSESIVD